MSLKNPVTPPGIDPGTVRLVAQRLTHYVTPCPTRYSADLKFPVKSYLTQTHDRVLKPEMRNTASFLDGGKHSCEVGSTNWEERPTLLPGSSVV